MDLDDFVFVGGEDDQKKKDRREEEPEFLFDLHLSYSSPADEETSKHSRFTKKCLALVVAVVVVLIGTVVGVIVFLSLEKDDVSTNCVVNNWNQNDYYNTNAYFLNRDKYIGITEAGDPGWNFISSINKCYRVSNQTASWSVAQERCNAEGGRLLTVPEWYTWDSLERHLYEQMDFYWIGLTSDNYWETLTWEDGSMMSNFTNWGKGQPSHGEDYCVHLFLDHTWNDHPCDFEIRHHICEKKGTNASCDSGWSFFQEEEKCIGVFMNSYLTLTGARSHCKARKGSLLTINSENKQQFISGILPVSTIIANFWIGVDIADPNNSTWVEYIYKTPKSPSLEYAVVESDTDGGVRCVYIDEIQHWNTASCGTDKGYICEKRGPGCRYRNGYCYYGVCDEGIGNQWETYCIPCPSGYRPMNGTCCDVNECIHDFFSVCAGDYTCDNLPGHYTCN